MVPWNLYKKICSKSYRTVGDGVDYTVEYDRKEKTIFVLFQESRGAVDWRTNFNFFHRHVSNGPVFHGGYYRAWSSASGYILGDLQYVLCDCEYNQQTVESVTVAGWSYGGAMALIAAWFIHDQTGIKCNVVTFGAPKVMKYRKSVYKYSSAVNRCFQYANNNDLVTYVVPFVHWYHYSRVTVGNEKTALKRILKPTVYHCLYGDESIYPR